MKTFTWTTFLLAVMIIVFGLIYKQVQNRKIQEEYKVSLVVDSTKFKIYSVTEVMEAMEILDVEKKKDRHVVPIRSGADWIDVGAVTPVKNSSHHKMAKK